MRPTKLALKPLVLILAAGLPGFSSAAVSADASYEIRYYFQDSDSPTIPVGGFSQPSTNTPFTQTTRSNEYGWSEEAISITAKSSDNGKFGGQIENDVYTSAQPSQDASLKLVFSDSITNNGNHAEPVHFDFRIDQLKFVFRTGATEESVNYHHVNSASFAANIQVNGVSVWSSTFSAQPASLPNSPGIGFIFKTEGTDIGLANAASNPSSSLYGPSDEPCHIFGDCQFSIENYFKSINLGTLTPNSTFDVVYSITLNTETTTYGGASSIYFNDPSHLSMSDDAPLSASLHFAAAPVPEADPASMMAVGLALLGVVGARRRKMR